MTICWHDGQGGCGGRERHDDETLFVYGRCRSGRRWFWAAEEITGLADAPVLDGVTDTESEAITAARAGVERLAAGRDGWAVLQQKTAARRLRDVNAARRAERPPSGRTEAGAVGYVYGTRVEWPDQAPDGGPGREIREVIPFRVIRKTAKRVYYIRREPGHGPGGVDTGYVDRQALERDGEVTHSGGLWWEDDFHLYATREAAEASLGLDRQRERRAEAMTTLKRLRREMAAAHPDRGGTNEEFLAARQRYERALRKAS